MNDLPALVVINKSGAPLLPIIALIFILLRVASFLKVKVPFAVADFGISTVAALFKLYW